MITLRPMTMEDARILFDWRNDIDTRKQSINTAPVDWEAHVAWLERTLHNPKRILVVASVDGTPVGTCRADEREDGFTEISYTVAPDKRGKGLSKAMATQFVTQFLTGKKLLAEIKKGHKPSESVAIALGLAPFSEKASENPDDPRSLVEWR